jgi:hypothetical protein
MLRRLSAEMAAIALIGVGCATSVTPGTGDSGGSPPGSGGSGGTGGTGGAGHMTTTSTGAGGCVLNADCPPTGDPCTVPTCINGACSPQPANDGAACDDGDWCTNGDTCQDGVCTPGTPKTCPPMDTCQVGACDPVNKKCTSAPGNEGAQCDDGDPCTAWGTCTNGTCAKGTPIDCSFLDGECSAGICDPQTGCVVQVLNNGTTCDPGLFNPCMTGVCNNGSCNAMPIPDGGQCDPGLFDPCMTGVCLAGNCNPQPVPNGGQCDPGFGDPCTIGFCQSGSCNPTGAPSGTPCDDFDFCTINDTCQKQGQNSTCKGGAPNPCAPQNGCYTGSCDTNLQACTAVPVANGTPCNDGDVCNTGKTCDNGACQGGQVANNGMACDDGVSCTSGETCNAGACSGGSGPTIYFADDFHDNSKGWQFDPEWEIAPAMASPPATFNPDPSFDHTSTGDNGVAGVVVGGNENPVLHPFYYMTSPAFDTSNAAGQVIFGYYRWLNSDYDPYMHNVVEVYNGASWVTLWKSGGSPGIADNAWLYFSYDVTAHKNAAMKVRFGFDITNSGVFTVGSWNVDDVMIASVACP